MNEKVKAQTLRILRQLFRDAYCRNFSLVLWDGTRVPAQEHERFTLHLNTPFALRAMLMPPIDLNPGRAYVEKVIDLTGDLEASVEAIMHAFLRFSKRDALALVVNLLRLPRVPSRERMKKRRGRRRSLARDAAGIASHYDQPTDFFRTFLDPELLYTCAYFDDGIETLAEAQTAKVDYVLSKLRITPGERLLDVGCGWGALILRAAERFGAVAHGITLSRAQYDEARRRIAERGLGDRVSVELRDYRTLSERTYDKIAGVGVVEHVGREGLADYFRIVYNALRPGGLFLNHGITDQDAKRGGMRDEGFINRYVFPDGDLLPISTILKAAEHAGFEVRDVENLREHYARTARAWLSNLEANAATAAAATDERTVRIYRLYLAGSAQGFACGRLGLAQSLLARPSQGKVAALPPTRRDLYHARPGDVAAGCSAAKTKPNLV